MSTHRETYTTDILTGIHRAMAADVDVREHTDKVVSEMRRLLGSCDIEKADGDGLDDYTVQLIDKFVGFVACGKIPLGGSASDYCAMNALEGVKGYRLRLRDDEGANLILHEMRKEFHAHALDPRRMFAEVSRAGIPIGRH